MTSDDYIKTLWTVDKIRLREDYEIPADSFNQIYGDGDVADDTITTLKFENMALSQEDVQILHDMELSVIEQLLEVLDITDLDRMLGEHGTNIEEVRESDTKHPIDIFNILKRTSKMWKIIQQEVKNDKISKILGEANL